MLQDEVVDFQPQTADLDYPGKLQQQQQHQQVEHQVPAGEQAGLSLQNGNPAPAAVPQQQTDSQVGQDTPYPVSQAMCVWVKPGSEPQCVHAQSKQSFLQSSCTL